MKPYWKKRFCIPGTHPPVFQQYDIISFRNGYAKDAPQFCIECKGIRIGFGDNDWGAEPNTLYDILSWAKSHQQKTSNRNHN